MCIEIIHDKQEKGCCYCKGTPLMNRNDIEAAIIVNDESYMFFQNRQGGCMFPIRYCPICGKKLERRNKQ